MSTDKRPIKVKANGDTVAILRRIVPIIKARPIAALPMYTSK
jgi:hypothetical protein